MDTGFFRRFVIESDSRVVTGLAKAVAERHREVRGAYEIFVRTLMDGARTPHGVGDPDARRWPVPVSF